MEEKRVSRTIIIVIVLAVIVILSFWIPRAFTGNIISENLERVPKNYQDMQSFIRPNETSLYVQGLDLPDDVPKALDEITGFQMRYRPDTLLFGQEEYWQTPKETLDLGHGDCEDWAVTTLSMIKAYNSSLQCYNVLWKTHLSIFCYYNNKYYLYDQDNTKFVRRLTPYYSELENKGFLRQMRNNYYDQYDISPKDRGALAAFDEQEIYTFSDDEDFVEWMYDFSRG